MRNLKLARHRTDAPRPAGCPRCSPPGVRPGPTAACMRAVSSAVASSTSCSRPPATRAVGLAKRGTNTQKIAHSTKGALTQQVWSLWGSIPRPHAILMLPSGATMQSTRSTTELKPPACFPGLRARSGCSSDPQPVRGPPRAAAPRSPGPAAAGPQLFGHGQAAYGASLPPVAQPGPTHRDCGPNPPEKAGWRVRWAVCVRGPCDAGLPCTAPCVYRRPYSDPAALPGPHAGQVVSCASRCRQPKVGRAPVT